MLQEVFNLRASCRDWLGLDLNPTDIDTCLMPYHSRHISVGRQRAVRVTCCKELWRVDRMIRISMLMSCHLWDFTLPGSSCLVPLTGLEARGVLDPSITH